MKILVVSHNCFSTTQNMGKTLNALFNEFNKDEIMQLYLYPSLPNIKKFDNYYRITDNDIIKSIIKRKKCGRRISFSEITEGNTLFENVAEAKTYKDINRNNDIVRRARDLLWAIGNWKTIGLKQWLNDEKPDVVFYALGDAIFSQKIAVWISKYLNIPLVTYVCDEFYFSNKKKSCFSRLVNFNLLRNIIKVQAHTTHNVTICDSLGELYKERFKTSYTTIMTGSSLERIQFEDLKSNKISYIGNLGLNRWKSLLDISDAITELNVENGWDYQLVYYGNENENLKDKIEYGGYLNPNQVKTVMSESVFLIHTETFDQEYNDRLKYSISTKIADSLASGIPLFAYGPDSLASMRHLIDNECAVICTNKDSLYETLKDVFLNSDNRIRVAENALKTAQKYHDTKKVGQDLYKVLSDINKLQEGIK